MRRFLGEALGLLLILAVLAAGGIAFALPWRTPNPIADTDLDRYVVDRNGSAYLRVETDGDGNRVSWTSDNVVEVPGIIAITGWPEEFNDPFELFVDELPGSDQIDRLQNVRSFETRTSQLEDGALQPTSSTYSALTSDGLLLFGFYRDDTQSAEVFDPPALLLPPDLHVGATWSTEGQYLGSAAYEIAGEVIAHGPLETALGEFEDCVEVETSFAVTFEGGVEESFGFREHLCAGAGSVLAHDLDADGNVTSTTTTIATDRFGLGDEPPAGIPLTPDETEFGDPSDWELRRMGRAAGATVSTESTFEPVYVPADPPYVLAGSVSGDLRAMSADDAGETVWRFQPGGPIYGTPAVDQESGRIYFGAADKKLYALDARGLFLWSFDTGDNIASRPLIVGGRVVFGSEDRRVYAVDAASGEQIWRADVNAGVTSSAAIHEDTVVIGADDGGVYGIAATTGERRWVYDAGEPVTSAITVADGIAFFGTTGGTVAAVDASTGEERWVFEDDDGGSLHAPLVVADGRVYGINEFGVLFVLDAGDGEDVWRSADYSYAQAAAPLLVPQGIVAGHYSASTVHLVDPATGDEIAEWDASESQGTTDSAAYFEFGATTGGGAIWLLDNGAVLRRLGAPAGGGEARPREPLAPAWVAVASDPPIDNNTPAYTPMEYEGSAVLIDYATNVYRVDAATGATEALGTVAPGAGNPYAGGTIAGDVILVGALGTLHAASLPEVTPLWTFESVGIATQPPVVVDDTVLWVAVDEGDRRLHALSLADGSVLWEVDLPGALLGGVAVSGDTVITGPGAMGLDLATGELRWRADVAAETLGIPTVSEDSSTVYIGGLADAGGMPTYAIDVATGEVLLTASATAPLNPLERVWEADDVLVVPTLDGPVIGLDRGSGAVLWTYEPPRPRMGTVTVDDGLVWLATESGQVFVIDAATGDVAYEFTDLEFPLGEFGYAQRPARVGDTMIFALGSFVIGFQVPTQGGA